MSTEKPSVVEALSRVMAEVQPVGKDSRNQQQGYNFRGVDAVVNAVGPVLRKHGVLIVPTVEHVAYNVVEVGQKRTPMRECTVTVKYTFYGPGGDSIPCTTVGEAMDSGDKSTPKAMSVAYRVALLQALCIPTDEPDPDTQSYERASRREEPVWDPAEQEMLRDGYEAEIAAAKSGDEITEIGKRVRAQRSAGDLSPATYQHLADAAGRRRAELDAEKPAEQPTLPTAADTATRRDRQLAAMDAKVAQRKREAADATPTP